MADPDFEANIEHFLRDPRAHRPAFENFLDQLAARPTGPKITSITPMHGPPGTMVTITGSGFSSKRWENDVELAGTDALVVDSTTRKVRAIIPYGATDGQIQIEVDGKTAVSPIDFKIDAFPGANSGSDGPPIFFAGAGSGGLPSPGVDAIGTVQVLVANCYATDTVPANQAATRTAIMTEFDNSITYYDEVSYGRTTLDLDYTNWIQLGGEFDDYVDASIDNIDNPDGLNRIVAEAAQGAVDQGLDLDDYVAMAVVLYLDGGFIRAWGGWSSSNFSYSDADTSINLTTSEPLGLMAIGDNADWGRFAHEVAHNFIDAGAVLGEDIYRSDLIDPAVASAHNFDLMGNHDSHPGFSAHFMHQLGYWNASNVIEVGWDRNAFSESYTLQAHGSVENGAGSRAHAVRIDVGGGLYYYIEARERNGAPTNTLIFDTQIPVGADDGGIVVTKVFTDQVDINQEMRFITLMHEELPQETGAMIEDPLRDLKITVGNVISTNPLVIDVDVEWAQNVDPDPDGTFDLEMSQADVSWRSDDIWVDRNPWGLTPEQVGGSTVATIERPRPGEINRLYAKVRCNGADAASNVKLTYYAITPPGVGDNGAWAPIATNTIGSIAAGGEDEAFVNWTPTIDEHTCLKVTASHQFGEVSPGNNSVQENVVHFAAPASSPPDAIEMTFSVRNPRDEKTIIPFEAIGLPQGYIVHVPNRWLLMEPLGERRITLTIMPLHDIANYVNLQAPKRPTELPSTAWVDIVGRIPHRYEEKIDITEIPGFTHRMIGGIGTSVTPKHRAEIRLEKDQGDKEMHLAGAVVPAAPDQRVTIAVRPEEHKTPLLIDVMTDDGGRFWVTIPLESLADPRNPWEGDKKLGGRFEAWAETTNADVWAPTRSDSCYFEFEKKRRRARDRALDLRDLTPPGILDLVRPPLGIRLGDNADSVVVRPNGILAADR